PSYFLGGPIAYCLYKRHNEPGTLTDISCMLCLKLRGSLCTGAVFLEPNIEGAIPLNPEYSMTLRRLQSMKKQSRTMVLSLLAMLVVSFTAYPTTAQIQNCFYNVQVGSDLVAF